MSRFLVVTWDGAGNLVSTLAIAEHLAERGHDVRLLGHRSIPDRAGSGAWRFRPFVHTVEFDSATPFDLDREMTVMARDLWFSETVARDVQDELAREPADVVVADCMLMGALAAGQAAGVPTVALFHSPFSGFRGGPMVEMLAPNLPWMNAFRARLGLPAVDSIAAVHDACALSLVVTSREFEMDMALPDNVRFVGPLLDGPPLTKAADDVAVDDGPEPLVVVSFSTSYQQQVDVLQRVVDALAGMHVKVVVTTGPAVSTDAVVPPANTVVARFVPHRQLLPKASAVVTHAGLGTVMSALAHGVPLVCLPMGRDQFYNAAMVERLGAGITVGADADAEAIAGAVRNVIDDATVNAGAKHVAAIIAGYGGVTEAGAELERLAATR